MAVMCDRLTLISVALYLLTVTGKGLGSLKWFNTVGLDLLHSFKKKKQSKQNTSDISYIIKANKRLVLLRIIDTVWDLKFAKIKM